MITSGQLLGTSVVTFGLAMLIRFGRRYAQRHFPERPRSRFVALKWPDLAPEFGDQISVPMCPGCGRAWVCVFTIGGRPRNPETLDEMHSHKCGESR